jgi:Ni,Fe-hydrogenase III component G
MIFIKKSLFIVILFTVFIPLIALQDLKMQAEIVKCFENGNSKKLSNYFNQSVELAVPGNKYIYSKAQAQQIVAKFFSENTPETFKIITTTSENDANNLIGLLSTGQNTFRVYIVLKMTDGNNVIHLLKIENRQEELTPQ